MAAALTFIIPVRHQDNARDWNLLKSNLEQTIRSIAAQRSNSWKAVVVANYGADLPEMPDRFSVARVDFPANPLHEKGSADLESFYDAFRIDKGRRVLAGLLHAGDMAHVMIVDDDDFVHCGLTDFVNQNSSRSGWYISDGWIWTAGGSWLYKTSDFNRICGSSHIIRADLYRMPVSVEEASPDYLRKILGSHVSIESILEQRGSKLAPLPFPGAIYRVGHPGAHSNSKGIMPYLPKKNLISLLRALTRLRLKTVSIERTYLGASPS